MYIVGIFARKEKRFMTVESKYCYKLFHFIFSCICWITLLSTRLHYTYNPNVTTFNNQ